MASITNETNDRRIAAQIQEIRDKCTRSTYLDVFASDNAIEIYPRIPGEPSASHRNPINVRRSEMQYEETMTAIGEILAQNYAQLDSFSLSELDSPDNSYPQFWRGLAANRVLTNVDFDDDVFPNEPEAALFLSNPALESVYMNSCTFSDGAFGSFCQGIRSSHIKKLYVVLSDLPPDESWSLLWSALEHGAKHLERLDFYFSDNTLRGAENGFESFLANNTTIQSLRMGGDGIGRDQLPFFGALGRGLAVNTAAKILELAFWREYDDQGFTKQLIRTVFEAGLDQNMAVNSLIFKMKVNPETVNDLHDGLERMMRNRTNAVTHSGHDQEESLPVLERLEIGRKCRGYPEDDFTIAVARAQFFDRLSRSDVIRVENVVFHFPKIELLLPFNVYDFIRSTQVTKSLVLSGYHPRLEDTHLVDLADAMEANNSISELEIDGVQFHKVINLLETPNAYRIRCQCRRNEIQVQSLRRDENLSLLPFVLSRLLSSDERPTDENERREIEARQLVDRTVAFEILREIPALFAVYGNQNGEE